MPELARVKGVLGRQDRPDLAQEGVHMRVGRVVSTFPFGSLWTVCLKKSTSSVTRVLTVFSGESVRPRRLRKAATRGGTAWARTSREVPVLTQAAAERARLTMGRGCPGRRGKRSCSRLARPSTVRFASTGELLPPGASRPPSGAGCPGRGTPPAATGARWSCRWRRGSATSAGQSGQRTTRCRLRGSLLVHPGG